jgi:hypothetical protein
VSIAYYPPSRTYYRIRSVLVEELGLARRDVHPSMSLAELVPEDKRQAVWRRLKQEGLVLPPLCVPRPVFWHGFAHVVHAVFGAAAWLQNLWSLLIVLPLALLAWLVTRPWAVQIRYGPLTVRDAVLYLTPYSDGLRAGYQWSHDEVAIKVRLIIAESLGLSLNEVTPEARLADLGAE